MRNADGWAWRCELPARGGVSQAPPRPAESASVSPRAPGTASVRSGGRDVALLLHLLLELLGMEGRGGLPPVGVVSVVYLTPVPTFQNNQTQHD